MHLFPFHNSFSRNLFILANTIMFFSSNNPKAFPGFPSYSYLNSSPPPPPPPCVGHESDNIFLHHHRDLFAGHLLLPSGSISVSNSTKMSLQDNVHLSNFLPTRKKPIRKDRHSKICTAQGIRDRRVRLSTKIAREFFDLQDMLRFDKASKTLDWLLTNSKMAIKELAKMNGGAKSISSDHEEIDNGGIEVIVPTSKEMEMKKMKKVDVCQIHSKESRAKARARARERTREKRCNQRLDELKECSHIWSQLRCLNQFDGSEKSGSCSHNLPQNWDVSSSIEHASFPAITTNMNLL